MASVCSAKAFKAPALSPSRGRHSLRVVARKTAAAAKTAWVCIDCGYVYAGKEPFEQLPNSYRCPVCNVPKRRFRKSELSSGKAASVKMADTDGKFDSGDKQFFFVAAAGGAAALGALYYFLSLQV